MQCNACTLEVAVSCQAGADFLVVVDCNGWNLVQSAAMWVQATALCKTRDPLGMARQM